MGIAERNVKHAEQHLEPGEQSRVGLVLQLKGGTPFFAFGAAGVLLSGLFNKKRRTAAAAAGLPIGAYGSNVVVTDRRLLVLNGKKLLAAAPIGTIRHAEITGGKMNATISLQMANGDTIEAVASKVGKPDVWVAAVNDQPGLAG